MRIIHMTQYEKWKCKRYAAKINKTAQHLREMQNFYSKVFEKNWCKIFKQIRHTFPEFKSLEELNKKHMLKVDKDTGQVIIEKNPNIPRPNLQPGLSPSLMPDELRRRIEMVVTDYLMAQCDNPNCQKCGEKILH